MTVTPDKIDGTTTRILPVNVYASGESTTTFDVANGINLAIQNNATLINLSLGGDGDSALLHQLIQQAHDKGIVFIAAAGNEPTTALTYPAAYPEVVAATAGDKRGNIASYANRGDFVDVIAPGSSIVVYNNQSYLVSGTSASTAYITGNSGRDSPQNHRSLFLNSSKPCGSHGNIPQGGSYRPIWVLAVF